MQSGSATDALLEQHGNVDDGLLEQQRDVEAQETFEQDMLIAGGGPYDPLKSELQTSARTDSIDSETQECEGARSQPGEEEYANSLRLTATRDVAGVAASRKAQRRRRCYTIGGAIWGIGGVAILLMYLNPANRAANSEDLRTIEKAESNTSSSSSSSSSAPAPAPPPSTPGYATDGATSSVSGSDIDIVLPPAADSTDDDYDIGLEDEGLCGDVYCTGDSHCCGTGEDDTTTICCDAESECCGGKICCAAGECNGDHDNPLCIVKPNCGVMACPGNDVCCGQGIGDIKICCAPDAICCGEEICCSPGTQCILDPSPHCLAPAPPPPNCGAEYCDADNDQYCCGGKICTAPGGKCCGQLICAPGAECSDPPDGGVCLAPGTPIVR